MCRFKTISILIIYIRTVVSIHPMCRFKFCVDIEPKGIKLFQYILCVGSRPLFEEGYLLNTKFQYILCVGSRSQEPYGVWGD